MNHSLPYNHMHPQYTDFNHYPSDRLADSAAEGRPVLYPSHLHPHPLFTRQGNSAPNNSLQLHYPPSPFTQQQNWPSYDTYSYPPSYPSPSPFPPPRLSPPSTHHTKSTSSASSQHQRLTLAVAGSLDPSTGIFYRTPEHPRLRTAQACEKCRTRKAKCSGEHPTCKRCLNRGLVCEYAKEGRVRGPNKSKSKPSNTGNDASSNTPANRNGHPYQPQPDHIMNLGMRYSVSPHQSPSMSEKYCDYAKEGRVRGPHKSKQKPSNSGDDDSASNTPASIRNGHAHQPPYRLQTDHLMTMGMPYNVSPLPSPATPEEYLMYPSPSYPQHYPLYGNGSRNAIAVNTNTGSPITSVSGGTSTINSPLTPASATPFVISPSASRINMKMDLDMNCVDPTLHSARSGLGSASIAIEPVWINHLAQVNTYPPHLNSEHSIRGTDERGQGGVSTQIETMEGSVFVKNGHGHADSPQDHFHGQSQSHNESYTTALDLPMC